MPRPLSGTVEWHATPDGGGHWDAKLTLRDKSRERFCLPEYATPAQKPAAKARAARLAVKARDGELVKGPLPTTAGPGETVIAWAARWIADRAARGNTSAGNDRGYIRNHVGPVFGHKPIATVARADLEDLVSALDAKVRLPAGHAKRISWKTAATVWGMTCKLFSDAAEHKDRTLRVRDDNPARGVRGPDRGDSKAKTFLYPSEFLQLVACARVDLEFRRRIAEAVYTYVRASEHARWRVGDVDLAHASAHVHRAWDRTGKREKGLKGKEARRIPLEAELLPLLRVTLADRPADAFVAPDLPRVSDLSVMLQAALEAAGLTRADLRTTDATRKRLTWHDLRATGLTWMAVRGDDPLKIQRRAGHKDFKTTGDYVRLAESAGDGFGVPFPPLPACLLGDAKVPPASVPPAGESSGESSVPPASSAEAVENAGESGVRATGFEPVTSSV